MTDKLTKITWDTQVFAPTHYPIELVAGESFWFFDTQAEDRVGFYALAGSGWRNGAVDTVGGSPSTPVYPPVGVKLMWLSLLERRFYHTVLFIPQAAIAELAAETLTSAIPTLQNHLSLQFAIAPHGFVTMRAGFPTHIKELIVEQAEVADASWSFFARTNHFDPSIMTEAQYIASHLDKIPPAILSQAEAGKLPTRWQAYSQQKFPWHLASDTTALTAYRVGYVNGETAFERYSQQPPEPTSAQPVPAWLTLFYKRNHERYQATLYLSQHRFGRTENPEDDVPVFEAFIKFFGASHRPAALVVSLAEDEPSVFLTNGHLTQALSVHADIQRLSADAHLWFT